MKTRSPKSIRAFSLLELLMVLAIMGIVATFLIPAVSQLVRGTPLTQAAQVITSQLSLARQYSVTKNRPVEVRMIQYGDPEVPGEQKDKPSTGKFRALQLMEVLESGALVALGKPQVFLNPVIMNAGTPSLSSLLDPAISTQKPLSADQSNNGLPAESNPIMPRGVERKYQYVAFRFLPNGSTNLSATQKWYVTLHGSQENTAGGQMPPNFFTVQIDPVNGSQRFFRPGLQ